MDKVIIDRVDVYDCENEYEIHDSVHCSDYISPCSKHPNCYYKQLKRKEQECEKLNWLLETKCESELARKYRGIAEKYKQTLQEIKEITREWLNNDWSCFHCRSNMDDKLRDILAKINEVIGVE